MSRKMALKSQNKISTDEQSDAQIDCSCQILNDTSLSNISDQSCDCSECLEANLDAFNQIRQLEQDNKLEGARSLDKLQTRTKIIGRQQSNNRINSGSRRPDGYQRSANKDKTKKSYLTSGQGQENMEEFSGIDNKFSQENLNDYIMITKQRTRQYLNQRNKLDRQNKKRHQQLKQKIKQNLEILKYTVQALKNKQSKSQNPDHQATQTLHHFKWNHTPAISPDIAQIRISKNQCKRKIQQRKKTRTKVNTNLQKIIPQFSQNPSQYLEQAKSKRLEKFKSCKGCPYDHCPNHHMRTSNERLQEIQNFIKQQVKKHNDRIKKQKQKEQHNQKVKRAKLRAIDIKCKQILKKSKKYDPSDSRTSFRLSIDHFSTFSELRENKKQKDEEKNHRKEVKKMMKQKGGRLQEAIYEEAFQNQQIPEAKPNKMTHQQIENIVKKDYCQKITKDAKIHSPRQLKPDDEKHIKQKTQKKKGPMNPNQEKKKGKELALEIERKKRELMEEYRRQQQLKQSKNEKLKNHHTQSLLMQSRG